MFVTAQDFNLVPYNIPNIDRYENTFDAFIEREEKDILTKILGFTLYDAFIAGLSEPTPADRWLKLRDGATYKFFGKTYRWNGMRDALIPYIYSRWLQTNFDNDSGIGIVVSDAENSTVISPGTRISEAYNMFADKIGQDFLTYWRGYCIAWYQSPKTYNNLFLFLYTSEDMYKQDITDDYSGIWEYLLYCFDFPGYKNIFDI